MVWSQSVRIPWILSEFHADTVYLGDASTLKSSQTYQIGSDIQSQQNGVVFANPNTLVSVSLSGALNVFDTRESSSTKWRQLHGPVKAITSSALSKSDKEATFYTGSFDGGIRSFNAEGECGLVEGTGHSARVAAMEGDGAGKVWSAGWDDRVNCLEGNSFT